MEGGIDRSPNENGQELTGLVEGSYPYRYKMRWRRVRSEQPRMHDSRSFHCAFTLRTGHGGFRRKNNLKDRCRLADREEEDATRTESRSFGQKATVVRCMHRLMPGNGYHPEPFVDYRRPRMKKSFRGGRLISISRSPAAFHAWSRSPVGFTTFIYREKCLHRHARSTRLRVMRL